MPKTPRLLLVLAAIAALCVVNAGCGGSNDVPSSDVAKVGDAVTAVGNAGGTGSLTAAGTISSLTAP